MRKTIALALVALAGAGALLLLGPLHAESSPAAPSIPWQVFGSGGVIDATSGGYTLSATAGQALIGWSAGEAEVGSGYWYGVGLSSSPNVHLPLVRAK